MLLDWDRKRSQLAACDDQRCNMECIGLRNASYLRTCGAMKTQPSFSTLRTKVKAKGTQILLSMALVREGA